MSRIFLLSPAHCGGTRARRVLATHARFALAEQLRTRAGAPLGDLFTFVSGLYFRGKLAYARRFVAVPDPSNSVLGAGIHVITTTAGLQAPETRVTSSVMRAFASVDVHPDNASYRVPLERSARALSRAIGPDCDVVLLGSIASPKYVDVLLAIFGDRLQFPLAFVGRGDMSRGGLLLRKVAEGRELEYAPVAGAALHGARPPRLPPLKRIAGVQNGRIAGST